MSVDLNEVKAGQYKLVAVFWDQVLSKPGEPFDFKRHRKGAIVELNVDDARRLVKAGAVVPLEDEATAADDPDGPPAKSASKGDWEAYARSQGATDADLEGKTKDQLVEAYGPKDS